MVKLLVSVDPFFVLPFLRLMYGTGESGGREGRGSSRRVVGWVGLRSPVPPSHDGGHPQPEGLCLVPSFLSVSYQGPGPLPSVSLFLVTFTPKTFFMYTQKSTRTFVDLCVSFGG